MVAVHRVQIRNLRIGSKPSNPRLESKSAFLCTKTRALFLRLAPKLVTFVQLWAYFSGSFDVLMNELLSQLFELPRHKALVLGVMAMFIRQPLFLNQRSKHRKITETLLLEKVRVLKKSSLVVFFKHGSNPSDSLLELNVVKNNKNTVLGHLLFNFLPRADPRLLWALVCLLRGLFFYREDNIFDNVHKNLDSLLDLLSDDLRSYLNGSDWPSPLHRLRLFGLLLHDLLADAGFKEFLWEHFLLEKIADIIHQLLTFITENKQTRSDEVLNVACELAATLAEGLDPFQGFDFPNSKVPKKFNGDHLLLRKTGLALSCCKLVPLALSILKKRRIKSLNRVLPWLAILDRLSGTQSGRCFLLFGDNSQALSKEKLFAIKRNSPANLKDSIDRIRSDAFAKLEFKFGSSFRSVFQSLRKKKQNQEPISNLEEAEFLVRMGRITANLLFGDDNDLKGISALRIYFLEKTFFKKKSVWEVSKNLSILLGESSRLENVETRNSRLIGRKVTLARNIFEQLSRALENYVSFRAKDVGISKLFRKKPKWKNQKKTRDFGRREDEKFKLRLQKYNQIHQRISAGKFNYEDDNIVPFLSDLEFFQSSRGSLRTSHVLGKKINSRSFTPPEIHFPEITLIRSTSQRRISATRVSCFVALRGKSGFLQFVPN